MVSNTRLPNVMLALSCLLATAGSVHAQRPNIYLPPTYGATELSTYIDAEARRLVATGILLESAAEARLTNANAYEKEIQNAKLWLETYFERKRMNQEYRRANSPSYIDQERRRNQVRENAIRDLPSEIANGDVTDDLNWLLEQLVADAESHSLLFSESEGDVAHLDRKLTPDEISHLCLREATGHSGGGQAFRADLPELLSVTWPVALSDRAFATENSAYETACMQAIIESRGGGLTIETWTKLRDALDRVTTKFNEVYSRKAMESMSGTQRVLLRESGKQFLQAQAVGVSRIFTAKDFEGLQRSYTFTGTTLVSLLRHCVKLGLEFAPPTPDDRATYRVLFNDIRHIYMEL